MSNDAAELRLAFVGCGRIAGFHLDGIEQAAPRTRVTAAVDPDPSAAEAIAARTGARTYGSLEQALAAGGFDAVDIMVPHDLHEELASRAFAAGKHVLLEKPMALALDACARIQEAARRAGSVFMVAENAQYWPDVVRARELLEEGVIGDAITARASFEAALDPFWYPSDSWRYEVARTGGGIVVDGGAHWIRPLRMWLGEVEEVVATTAQLLPVMQGESLAHALLRFRSGVVASFQAITHDAPLWAGTVVAAHRYRGRDRHSRRFRRRHDPGRPAAPAGTADRGRTRLCRIVRSRIGGLRGGGAGRQETGGTAGSVPRRAAYGAGDLPLGGIRSLGKGVAVEQGTRRTC